jgi:hypothetical protein
MYGRNAQKLNKRQEYIRVHVFYKRDQDKGIKNLTFFDFLHFYLGMLLGFSFWAISFSTFLFQLYLFHGFIDPVEVPTISAQISFSALCIITFFQYAIFVEELNFVFPLDYKFSFIIDSSSLIHEIIHGRIFEKFQGINKWEVWVINRGFWCFGYSPENTRFPIYTIKLMVGYFIHLIHDLIACFFDLDVYCFFDYIKEFFTTEKFYVKELKTQIKARKT